MNMNRMLAVVVMTICSPAVAQSWTEIDGRSERIYVNVDSDDRDSGHPSVWVKRVNDKGSEILTHEQYDCAGHTFAIKYAVSKYADGRSTDPITSSSNMQNPIDSDASKFRAGVFANLCSPR